MNENEHQDQLDQPTSDQLDAGSQDDLQAPASDQLDQDAGDQLGAGQSDSQDVQEDAGDGETTGDQNVAPAFPDDQADDENEHQASLPHPYSTGFGVAGKFDSEAAPTGDVVQDDDAPAVADSQ